MDDIKRIVADIDKRQLKPIYFLMGQESYYIDQLANYIEENVLTEEEKGFNQSILYGKDVSVDEIISAAKRFPMMAEYQVIIVKEAQDLSRNIEDLILYLKQMQPTTILVFCYKYKTLDKRKKLYKAIKEKGEVVESKRLYDNQIPDWIKRVLHGKNYSISPKAAILLLEFLGTDLAKINNELQKLMLVTPQGQQITPHIIEENIGISKDFNNFELQNALGQKDFKKAFRIINYFSQNPKEHPVQKTTPLLYLYFSKLLKYHALSDKSKFNAAKQLGINAYFVKDYVVGAKNYPMKKVSAMIEQIRTIDAKSKGVNAASATNADLLKELLINAAK
ncbi:DNA polymerase III subunit delta [Haloflavibacter putidus]|uniref:DNA polymerase III subunit delta n=1 Tax=Haloflavibacter putidus TaxID=2576776 RepID=A0A507ZAF8_9FLAO|nr:DNA polymerase III subunit delta [Haloflavibacter putidus]TQD34049.1 DNA polymerase III subunit delta [Haloflavibacter putidus]